MNPLGHQLQVWSPAAKNTIHAAPGHVLKLIGSSALDWHEAGLWRQARPDGYLIYRPDWPYQSLDNPEADAMQVVRDLGTYRSWIDYAEGPNEIAADRKHLPRLAEYCVRFGRVLRREGVKYLTGSFPRGRPFVEDWPLFFPALAEAQALGVHEYGYPDRQGDLLHYRELLDATPPNLQLPVIVSEMGTVDDDRAGGWRKYESEEQMVSRMRTYAQVVAKDPRVLGVVTFVTGTWETESDGSPAKFWSFELADCKLYEALVNEDMPGPVQEDKQMGLKDQFPGQYAAWVAAGGDESAFGAHLRGIKALPADPKAALENVKSAVAQLENQLPLA